jgi:hypothetical protein
VKTEPLPGSIVTVTSPSIMRASLRDKASPEPDPPVAPRGQGIGLGAFLEQLRLLIGREPDAGIGDRELDPVTSVRNPERPQRDLALLGELAGVAQEVEQDLPKLVRWLARLDQVECSVDGAGGEIAPDTTQRLMTGRRLVSSAVTRPPTLRVTSGT